MFLEAFSLKRVYVPLRAYYYRKVNEQPGEPGERHAGNRQSERVVVELEKELESWLSKAVKTDGIRLISGGPGSGKSSVAKMLAAKLAEKGTLPVLFIPLHHFEPSDDLIDSVGKFVQMDGILPHNPLAADQRESRLLIIFDGLDELAMQGKIAEKTAQDFVREVQRKVERFNQRETCLQVLISGRELVVQANETDLRKDGQILHVLPYFVPEHDQELYVDRQKLLEQDQRQFWWQNYGMASGSGYGGFPTELDQGNLIEITAQPLLNYLVALSLRRGELQFSEATNLNAVYADLIKAIYERGWAGHQHTAIQGIEKNDFVRVLEEIALAAWHGNGRTTTVREIEHHCESSNLKNLLNRFQAGYQPDSKTSITRLMTAFYFRQSGHDHSGDKTFEFTHKSFGEYLTARRIVQEVQYIHRKLQDRYKDSYDNWDERSALHRWALACGASAMDRYLFKFVLDEMHLQKSTDVAEWQQTLCNLIGFVLRYGMPMEDVKSIHGFKEQSAQARNAEEALLVALNACACVTKIRSSIDWGNSQITFGEWISKLQGQREGPMNVLALSKLSFLNLEECILYVGDFWEANLEFTNFKKSQLDVIVLCQANLRNADFREASLWRANLSEANLSEADLRDSELNGADFRYANLARADLRGASLVRKTVERISDEDNLVEHKVIRQQWRTNLEGANLEGANLERVNLTGVNLERANLEGANLQNANLEGANLEGANLEGVNLQNANLEGANLKETILDGKVPIPLNGEASPE